MTAPLTVDVTGWLIARLKSALTARVGAETPADLEAQVPFVRVVRVGGPNDGFILDVPTMVFHCFATDQQGANQLGYQVIQAVMGARAVAVDGAVLTRVRTLSGPTWAAADSQALRHAAVTMQTRIKTTGQ